MFSFLVVAKYQYALARNFNFLTTAEKNSTETAKHCVSQS